MSVRALSLGALALAIVVICVTRLNVGVLSLALTWIIGVYFAGMTANDVMSGFPNQLFLTLAGVTLLLTLAQANATHLPISLPHQFRDPLLCHPPNAEASRVGRSR